MRKLIFIIAIVFSMQAIAQQGVDQTIEETAQAMSLKGLSEEAIKDFLNKNIDDPKLYNDAWNTFLNFVSSKDSSAWNLLKDMNVVFKTFQSTTGPSAVGFSYDFTYNYNKFTKTDKSRTSNSLNFKARGNVSFNRDVNPNDFLDTSLDYAFTKFYGGVVKKADSATFTKLNAIEDQLALLNNPNGSEAQKLWEQYYSYLQYSDQYYISFSPELSLESNQNFTNKQFVYSGNLALGMKSWDKNSTLSSLNIFDYPFALIRWVTGTDKKFQPYGSTFPSLLAGINFVNPINDFARQQVTGNTDGYERMNLESSFRTFVAEVEGENIFFNANIRYYKELGASAAIKAADLDEFFYFVGALQSSSGFYVSYARGTLPFDVQSDEVYSVGFHYKF
jgi:hypothetical protein